METGIEYLARAGEWQGVMNVASFMGYSAYSQGSAPDGGIGPTYGASNVAGHGSSYDGGNGSSYGPSRPVDIQSIRVTRRRSICSGPERMAVVLGFAHRAS